MNEQEKNIIEDSITEIKKITNIAISLICKTEHEINKQYSLNRMLLDIAEDTIGNLIDIKDGKYAEPKEDLCCKGE